VSLTRLSGWACQAANTWGFTLSNATIGVTGGSNGVHTLASNTETFTVTIGSKLLTGDLPLNTVTSSGSLTPLILGTITNTGESGFAVTGFPAGAVVDTDHWILSFGSKIYSLLSGSIRQPRTQLS